MRARTSLKDWCLAAGYEPQAHHQLVLDALADVAAGDDDRVMIFMPPGSAKSTYASILFPPWYLCQFPQHNLMGCSHTMTLAERFSKRVRALIQNYPDELELQMSATQAAVKHWKLADRLAEDGVTTLEGGEYMAAGVDTGIAGFRSDLTLIDDPITGKEMAESEGQRQKVWDWWVFDVQPRLKPTGKVVLIMTRWHEEDLAGRILAQEGRKEDGGRWRVISLPMEAEDAADPLGRAKGERLWPEWFTDEMVATAKRDPQLWMSLYQQRPTAAEGTYWKRQWFNPVPGGQVPPKNLLRIYGGSDYATKQGSGDYTVHAVIGIDPDDRPWLLDIWREQTTADWWISSWCDLVIKHKPLQWAEERGQIINAVGPFLDREQRKRKAYTSRVQVTSVADKHVMAQAMRGQVATMGLWYDQDAPWRAGFENELLGFPSVKHDDQHDALGKIGQLLATAVKGEEPKARTPTQISGYGAVKSGQQNKSMKVL